MRAAVTDWTGLAARARRRRAWRGGALVAFLTMISVPIILPYVWMLVIALTSRTGSVEAGMLWRACAAVLPVVVVHALLRARLTGRWGPRADLAALALGALALAVAMGGSVHLQNFRFLWNPDLTEHIRGRGTAGGQFPSVWEAFGSSLLMAGGQTLMAVTIATMAGYYLSRFAFAGRSAFLQGMLVLQAFPAMTLTIPLFLISYWTGLLNTLAAPVLVLTALELPFFVFIMKGFFDAVPWEIEMSALTDGATRRQAFRMVVLPQVRAGMIAIGVFAFIRGWEEYVFVNALRTGNSYWVMSTYLYYVAEDVMGVDYGLVAAVAVFYLLPSLILYVACQRYLTQMTLGGVKG
jgi:inositol-phosphate transport system permease protein